jgi:hypothetical protein
MADNSGILRDYRFTDGDLALFANSLGISMTRDLAQLAQYGITILKINDLINLVNVFQAMPIDDTLRTDLSYAVEQRDILMNTVLNTMRSISLRAKAVFGENSAKYRAMSPGSISQMSDSELLISARQVYSSALTNAAALAPEGVTPAFLTTFNNNIQAYENAIDEVARKKISRDDSSEAKVIKGNEIYGLVVKYCDYGKLIWDGVSPAKYNDYVIYSGSGPSGLSGKIQGMAYTVPTNAITWTPDPVALTYEVEISPDGILWTLEYDQAEPEARIGRGPGTWHARCRGINDKGSGAWSDVLEYYIPLATPEIYDYSFNSANNRITVMWHPVSYANYCEVWSSMVNLGDPAGAFSVIAQPVTTPYANNSPTHDKTYYYYIIGKNVPKGIDSLPSATVRVDVPI